MRSIVFTSISNFKCLISIGKYSHGTVLNIDRKLCAEVLSKKNFSWISNSKYNTNFD